MDEHELLAERFETHRARLREVAYRMLGSAVEADDAVQEAWLRLAGTVASEIGNLGGWLTTVVARICLDLLRAGRTRYESALDDDAGERLVAGDKGGGVEEEVLRGDAASVAMAAVVDRLPPAERVTFVLHDLFAMPFDDIAPIVDRTVVATRQLASRARRRLQGVPLDRVARDRRQRVVVEAFLAASRGGDLAALVAILDPAVVARADRAAIAMGVAPQVRGVEAVAQTFLGRARAAQLAVVGGIPGLAWAPGGNPRVVFAFRLDGERITGIELLADPGWIAGLGVAVLDG